MPLNITKPFVEVYCIQAAISELLAPFNRKKNLHTNNLDTSFGTLLKTCGENRKGRPHVQTSEKKTRSSAVIQSTVYKLWVPILSRLVFFPKELALLLCSICTASYITQCMSYSCYIFLYSLDILMKGANNFGPDY